MSDNKRTDVNELGEFGLIDHLTEKTIVKNSSTRKGVGDDAAVIDNGQFLTVVSTDALVEGIHFDLMYMPLKHLGYKSVVVNLSDIYAMNAQPKQVLVSIAMSNRFSVEALEELYDGIHTACKHYGVDLIGGDTTSAPKGLFISVTAIGQGEKEKLVYRNGAKVGERLLKEHVDLRLVGNIGGNGQRFAVAGVLNRRRNCGGARAVAVTDDDTGALGSEALGNGLPDPLGRTGNNDNLVGETFCEFCHSSISCQL